MFNRILMSMSMLGANDITDTTTEVGNAVITYLNLVLSILLGIAAAVAAIYAIVVGVRMARANNAEEREEAKKKVIYTVAGVLIAIALIIIMNIIKANIGKWTGTDPISPTEFIGLL